MTELASQLDERRARKLCDRIRSGIEDTANLVVELYRGRGWTAIGYASFKECCREEFQHSVVRQLSGVEQATPKIKQLTPIEREMRTPMPSGIQLRGQPGTRVPLQQKAASMRDELTKLCVLDPIEAQRSRVRLQQNRKTNIRSGLTAAGYGAVAAPVLGAVGSIIQKKPIAARGILADAAKGALGGSLIQAGKDRALLGAEKSTLKHMEAKSNA